jgi:hypothetical protein
MYTYHVQRVVELMEDLMLMVSFDLEDIIHIKDERIDA